VLVRAVNTIPASLLAPGVVRQPGRGELILADPAAAGPAALATGRFLAPLRAAGLPVRTVPELAPELWRKALVNAAINPVTALYRVENGRLLEAPYRAEAARLLREAQRASALAGFPFTDEEADRSLELVLRATAGNRSSMLQDVERGRPTEIDAISGAIVRTAASHGVDLPATRAVIARLGVVSAGRARGAQPS
jgi:2-dehydropantoate 2-reductase